MTAVVQVYVGKMADVEDWILVKCTKAHFFHKSCMAISNYWFVLTRLGAMVPGHQAMVGSLIPPSNVVSLPHKNGPLLPAANKEYISRIKAEDDL